MAERLKRANLERSEMNKVLAGVCGGLGEFLGIDPTIVRWAFVLFTLFGGSGILVYLVLWLLIPSPSGALIDKENLKAGVEKVKTYTRTHDSGKTIGLILLVLGIIFLFNNLGLFRLGYLYKLWPLALIFLAFAILKENGK